MSSRPKRSSSFPQFRFQSLSPLLDENKNVIRRYYADLWNRWGGGADLAQVRAAFPDFHNQVDELVAEGDAVAARLTYSGTHEGELFGVAPTHQRVEYGGIAFFRIFEGQITSGLVYGDTMSLMGQIGATTPNIS